MRSQKVNATRMQLTLFKKRLKIAIRGYKLLKDKQDAMVQKFMQFIKENERLRKKIDKAIKMAVLEFSKAQVKSSKLELLEALAIPMAVSYVDVDTTSVMNVSIPKISVKSDKVKGVTYGFSFTPVALDESVIILSSIVEDLLCLAEVEKTCLVLGKEIEKTRRRVNAIEFVMIPEMTKQIKLITNRLEDNERSNIIRLMKAKEIILKNG